MSALSLLTTLERLAELLPERVMGVGHTTCRIIVGGQMVYLDLEDAAQYGPWLEYALREECEARGWDIRQMHDREVTPPYTALVFSSGPGGFGVDGSGDSHAEALALALLGALEGVDTSA